MSALQSLGEFHYLRWDELPEEPVFLDELVAIVNEMHAAVPYGIKKKKCFTTSMASNYVKQKLTPPPLGKRYTREHISKILFASTLKIVFNAEDVAALVELEYAGRNCAEAHDRIAAAFDSSMRSMLDFCVRSQAVFARDAGLNEADAHCIDTLLADAFSSKVLALSLVISR